jgi:CII-binding regulator of phage lambda lysogenization HflD
MKTSKPSTSITFENGWLNALEPLLEEMRQLHQESKDQNQEFQSSLNAIEQRISILEDESSQLAAYSHNQAIALQGIDRSVTTQNQASSSQSAQLSQFMMELTALHQHQTKLTQSIEQSTRTIQSLQNQIVSSEAKTGDRLVTLTQDFQQLQQAIPSPASFPLKLFVRGEIVNYWSIVGLISVTGILGGMLTWVLLLLMPPAIQQKTYQINQSSEKRLEQLEQNQRLLLQNARIQPPAQQP